MDFRLDMPAAIVPIKPLEVKFLKHGYEIH